MSRANPTAGVWIALVGGVALVGTAIYFATRGSSTASAAPNTPPPTTPPPPASSSTPGPNPAGSTYSMTFKDGGSFALRVGETVELLPPGPAQADARWEFQVVNTSILATFAHGDNAADSNTAVDTGTFKAVSPGRATIMMSQYIPRQGPVGGAPQAMTVMVSLNVGPELQG